MTDSTMALEHRVQRLEGGMQAYAQRQLEIYALERTLEERYKTIDLSGVEQDIHTSHALIKKHVDHHEKLHTEVKTLSARFELSSRDIQQLMANMSNGLTGIKSHMEAKLHNHGEDLDKLGKESSHLRGGNGRTEATSVRTSWQVNSYVKRRPSKSRKGGIVGGRKSNLKRDI